MLDTYMMGVYLGWPEFDCADEPTLNIFLGDVDYIDYIESVWKSKRMELPWGERFLTDTRGRRERIEWNDPAWWAESWREFIVDTGAQWQDHVGI